MKMLQRVLWLMAALALVGGGAGARTLVVADGLDDPRGVAVSWGGRVFVAEAGHGGDRQVAWPAPIGHALAGRTGRVSMLLSGGGSTPIMSGLPSVALGESGEVVGPSGLAFRGTALFAGIGSAVPGSQTPAWALRVTQRPRAIWRVDTWDAVAQYAAESNPYGLVFDRGRRALYVADAGANAILRGWGWRYALETFKAWDDDPVPTAVAFGPDGCLYVSMFGHYPFAAGSARIERVHPDGESEVVASGLTALTDVTFDRAGRLYAVQFGEFDGERWLPNTGAVLRIDGAGRPIPIADGLNFPNKIAFGHYGELFVTVNSAYSPPYSGKLLMITGVGPPGVRVLGRY
jgi:hypothetical protein